MQGLGITESGTRSENRLKSLFWPNIESEIDVDSITTQGMWVCFVIGAFSFIGVAFAHQLKLSVVAVSFYFFGAMGTRMRSWPAAATVWAVFLLNGLFAWFALHVFPGTLWAFGVVLLTANLRATWLSSRWRGSGRSELPPELEATFMEKVTDKMPRRVWPWGRWMFVLLAVIQVLILGLATYQVMRIRDLQRSRRELGALLPPRLEPLPSPLRLGRDHSLVTGISFSVNGEKPPGSLAVATGL